MKSIKVCLLIGLLAALVSSCKKDGASPDYGQGVGSCRLKQANEWTERAGIYRGIFNAFYEYDELGRMISAGLGSENTTWKIKYFDYGFHVSRAGTMDSFFTDSEDKIVKYRRSSHYGYFYVHYNNNNEVMYEVSKDNAGAPNDTTFYEWEDGDLVKICSQADTTLYTYYKDEPYQIGSFEVKLFSRQFLSFISTKHLLKSANSVPLTANYLSEFTYKFDEQHKIVSAISWYGLVSDTRTINYKYDCN